MVKRGRGAYIHSLNEILSWVPTYEEVDRISKTLVSIDSVNMKDSKVQSLKR